MYWYWTTTQDTVLFLLQKTEGLSVLTQANDGTTVLHRVAAASVRALQPSQGQPEEELAAISPAAGAWLSLLAILLNHCTEEVQGSGSQAAAMLVRDRDGDSALHLLVCCKGTTLKKSRMLWGHANLDLHMRMVSVPW